GSPHEHFSPFGVVHFPGLPQDAPHRSVHRFGQPLQNVARLVNLATLDRRIASKRAADRLGQRLRAIDDEQTSHRRIKSTLDEIVDERLHGRRIFGRALDEAERMFVAVRVDADRRDEKHILIHVNAVNLDRQQIEIVEPAFHPRLHARRRQRHEAAGGRRLRQSRSVGRRNVSPGQPDRTLETPRRDVDQHLIHRPFAEQVFADGALPTRQYALGPVEPANPWALDLDLATVKADLAFGPSPAVRLASLTPLVALATGRCRILLQHLAQRLEPGGKAKAFKARRHARQRLGLQRIRGNCGRRGMLLHGVAFLSWNQHPEPKGSRRATPLLPFQHSSGQPRNRLTLRCGASCGKPGKWTTPKGPKRSFAISPAVSNRTGTAFPLRSWKGSTRCSLSRGSASLANCAARSPAPTSSRMSWARCARSAATSNTGARPRWPCDGPPPPCRKQPRASVD